MATTSRGRDHMQTKPLLLPRESSHLFVSQAQIGRGGPILKSWSFGKGTVIWKIWPAVLLHTLVAAAVVASNVYGGFTLGIPNVMLTVLGVVIGFVLAYRVSSGYDRYWMGRSYWSDIIRTSRTLARLIWFHVPLKLDNHTEPSAEAREVVMKEKRLALDLIEAYAVATKHYLRGERGIFYEDLYPLVKPLHDDARHSKHPHRSSSQPAMDDHLPCQDTSNGLSPNPVIPAVNSYGATGKTTKSLSRRASHLSFATSASSAPSLLPYDGEEDHGRWRQEISSDVIPFLATISYLILSIRRRFVKDKGDKSHKTRHPINIPLSIIDVLTEYLAELESRGVVPGTAMGPMVGTMQTFEDALTGLERILTTPLPFIYSVHISAIWIYLFFLPFQLLDGFGWYTIPGVSIAAFFYLGFLAAGDQIEQPFGYDENDLDLDSFIQDILHVELADLKSTPCQNAHFVDGGAGGKRSITEIALESVHKHHNPTHHD